MKHLFSTFFVGVGLAALAAGNLGAIDVVSQNLNVPFDFKVENTTFPAGQYRIEREFGKETVYVVNIQTGRRIRMIRDSSGGMAGKATLTFETTPQGYKLAKVS